MNEIKLEEIRQAVKTPATQIKLWENLSIETLGPVHYRRHLAPLYKQILEIMCTTGKRLQVHYDGHLKVISEDIAVLPIDGIDSFTEPPEGDMSTLEARNAWPDKFIWQNINLNWYRMPKKELADNITRIVKQAGPSRFCLMISEDVPQNWRQSVPAVLEILKGNQMIEVISKIALRQAQGLERSRKATKRRRVVNKRSLGRQTADVTKFTSKKCEKELKT